MGSKIWLLIYFLIYRKALTLDKNKVMKLCQNTFEWGDYIDKVWTIWLQEPNTTFYVVEKCEKNNDEKNIVGIGHCALCSNKTMVWIEGIRVHAHFRRNNIASTLITKMLNQGINNKINLASTIVSIKNIASQNLMEKHGFNLISKWVYVSIKPHQIQKDNNVRFARISDYKNILKYLKESDIFSRSGKRYVHSWRWYFLTNHLLYKFLKNRQIILAIGNQSSIIQGILIFDQNGYWNDSTKFQVMYVDVLSDYYLPQLIEFTINLVFVINKSHKKKYHDSLKPYFHKIQFFIPSILYKDTLFAKENTKYVEEFFLYNNNLSVK
ncbi:MAG: GNAT family N-acetyltransferase [Nitrososphaeraceae archaeon]